MFAYFLLAPIGLGTLALGGEALNAWPLVHICIHSHDVPQITYGHFGALEDDILRVETLQTGGEFPGNPHDTTTQKLRFPPKPP